MINSLDFIVSNFAADIHSQNHIYGCMHVPRLFGHYISGLWNHPGQLLLHCYPKDGLQYMLQQVVDS